MCVWSMIRAIRGLSIFLCGTESLITLPFSHNLLKRTIAMNERQCFASSPIFWLSSSLNLSCASNICARLGLRHLASESRARPVGCCRSRVSLKVKKKQQRSQVNLRSIFAERCGFRADHAPFFRTALLRFSQLGSGNERGPRVDS